MTSPSSRPVFAYARGLGSFVNRLRGERRLTDAIRSARVPGVVIATPHGPQETAASCTKPSMHDVIAPTGLLPRKPRDHPTMWISPGSPTPLPTASPQQRKARPDRM
ncbi:MAG: hypothetical protein ACXVGB_06385, partial [Mycobacteriaceae bacterium]